MLLRCRRKYFTQLSDIVQIILGYRHKDFISFQFYCQKAPFLMMLKELRRKMLECVRWKDVDALRLLLKANEIRIRRSSFEVDTSIQKLACSIFSESLLRKVSRAETSASSMTVKWTAVSTLSRSRLAMVRRTPRKGTFAVSAPGARAGDWLGAGTAEVPEAAGIAGTARAGAAEEDAEVEGGTGMQAVAWCVGAGAALRPESA